MVSARRGDRARALASRCRRTTMLDVHAFTFECWNAFAPTADSIDCEGSRRVRLKLRRCRSHSKDSHLSHCRVNLLRRD